MTEAKWITDQKDFELVAAEAVAWMRFYQGEHGPSMSCPIKKMLGRR